MDSEEGTKLEAALETEIVRLQRLALEYRNSQLAIVLEAQTESLSSLLEAFRRFNRAHSDFHRWSFFFLDPQRLRNLAQKCRAEGDGKEAKALEQLAERREKFQGTALRPFIEYHAWLLRHNSPAPLRRMAGWARAEGHWQAAQELEKLALSTPAQTKGNRL
jgi:hypothetical protein